MSVKSPYQKSSLIRSNSPFVPCSSRASKLFFAVKFTRRGIRYQPSERAISVSSCRWTLRFACISSAIGYVELIRLSFAANCCSDALDKRGIWMGRRRSESCLTDRDQKSCRRLSIPSFDETTACTTRTPLLRAIYSRTSKLDGAQAGQKEMITDRNTLSAFLKTWPRFLA